MKMGHSKSPHKLLVGVFGNGRVAAKSLKSLKSTDTN